MKFRKSIGTDYLTFSKKQRTGLLIGLGILAICLVVRFGYGFFIATQTVAVDSNFVQQVAQLKAADTERYANNTHPKQFRSYADGDGYASKPRPNNYKPKGELFFFDPNTLDAEGWKKLGLRDKTVQTIQNFVSMGGKFRQPDDIKKIYGLFPDESERLIPYVKIASQPGQNSYPVKSGPSHFTENRPTYIDRPYVPKTIDINTADTTAFIALPGIGSKLAMRIIVFREKLGGFASVDQVGETYGLQDSVFQKLKPRLVLGTTAIKQFSINAADANSMKTHPYFKWNIANAIVQYRTQHGAFASLNDLKKIALIDEGSFKKMLPYCML